MQVDILVYTDVTSVPPLSDMLLLVMAFLFCTVVLFFHVVVAG